MALMHSFLNSQFNYDRLELLGDSVQVKFILYIFDTIFAALAVEDRLSSSPEDWRCIRSIGN